MCAIAALIGIVIPLLMRIAKSVDMVRADLRDTSKRFMETDFVISGTVNHASGPLEQMNVRLKRTDESMES